MKRATLIFAALGSAMGMVWVSTPGATSPWQIFTRYFETAAIILSFAIIFWAAFRGVQLIAARSQTPLVEMNADLKERLPLLSLPLLIFPLFMSLFSAAKSGIGAGGFRYDRTLADLDLWLFGVDPWRLTHAVASPSTAAVINFLYVPVWMAVLAYTTSMIPLLAKRETVLRFYVAMMLAWLIGNTVAINLSSAGPIFVQMLDPDLAARFGPLKASLALKLDHDALILEGQRYLAANHGKSAYGGGISAMPSMHVAFASLSTMFAYRTPWFVPAVAFTFAIFFGSIFSGYHYFSDGIVGAAVAGLSFGLARWLLHTPERLTAVLPTNELVEGKTSI